MGPNRIASLRATEGSEAISASYYHSDHLGSSNIITNSAGNLVSNCEYLPYGEFSERVSSSQLPVTNYYFTGKELDDETGLVYFGARYYDPSLGRWTQADPTIQFPYNLQSLNRYSYCLNNPLRYVDPAGLNVFEDAWDWFKDNVIDPVKEWFEDNWQYVATAAMVVISVVTFGAASPITIGMITGSITGGISAYQAGGDVGNGVLFGAIVGGITGAAAGGFKDYFLNNVFANQFISPMQGGLITAGEFAIGGFGAGVISGYAGGEGDLRSMMKGGLMGAGIGAATGFAVGYTYTAGWQSVLHGADTMRKNQSLWQRLKIGYYKTGLAMEKALHTPIHWLSTISEAYGPMDSPITYALDQMFPRYPLATATEQLLSPIDAFLEHDIEVAENYIYYLQQQ